MLIEIHILQNHAPSNLNRDDTGSPKECVFGGYTRARISSQCLKRTIRRSDIFTHALGTTEQARKDNLAIRTRQLPEEIRKRLMDAGFSTEIAVYGAERASGVGTNAEEAQKPDKYGKLLTKQTMFLTERDITAVFEAFQEIAQDKTLDQIRAAFEAKKKGKKKGEEEDEEGGGLKLQALARGKGFRPITVDIALFGRMTTSEAFRDVDASCQVAHALSTHKVDHEYDYYTAVDDLQGQGEEEEDPGADMIGDVEFNSACYYKYLSVDLGGLVDNLTGKSARRPNIPAEDTAAAQALAINAVEALLRAALLTTPTGKQNTFAAHQLPAAVLVEVRPVRTPVSYANAFVQPARPGKGEDLVTDSLHKFAAHVQALTDGFNLPTAARFLLAPLPEHQANIKGVENVPDLQTLCTRLREVAAHG